MITNYTELQAEVANWLDRTDLTAQIPTFIQLAEKKMNRLLTDYPRRTYSATGITGDHVFPNAHLRILNVTVKDDHPLDLVTMAEYSRLRAENATAGSEPAKVFVATDHADWSQDFGTTLRFWPVTFGSTAIRVDYIGKPEPLSGTQPSNDVLRAAPDVYLYGALAEAAKFLQQDNAPWEGHFHAAIKDLNDFAQKQHFSGAPRPQRLPVVF